MGALIGLAQLVVPLLVGERDKHTGETIAKGLLTSKTMQGGMSLVAIPPLVFPLVDDIGMWSWATALTKLLLMVAAFGWLTYGRATAGKPLG